MTLDVADLVVGLFEIGMAIAFVAADRQSPTSRALGLCIAVAGTGGLLNFFESTGVFAGSPLAWVRGYTIVEFLGFSSAFEWALRVARTETARDAGAESRERLLRTAQGVMAVYLAIGLSFPHVRAASFTPATWSLSRPGFYLFAVPLYSAIAAAALPIFRILRTEIDEAERIRLTAVAYATPLVASGIVVSAAWRPVTTSIGAIILLIGAVRYHVIQGRRGQFLARFLSPQVVRLVAERGLAAAMQETRLELSVVVCDLRGFTAFSETAAPEELMKLLREYYAAMGEAVSEFGGTIKDYAGDGILTLVGAPIPYPDHATRALAMGGRMRERGAALLAARGLGLGVGVASGPVTVGALGGAERLEYVAVGPTVNLASRLCARAEPGQILVDETTVARAGGDGPEGRFASLDAVELKGFAKPIAIHELVG